jgi:hypothetical protein
MKVWIVRHGDERQAEAMCGLLAADTPRRLVSSPAPDCMGTLGPLARATGLKILPDTALAHPTSAGRVVELIGRQPDRTVICTDATVMEALLAALRPAGLAVVGAAGDQLVGSGVVWELDLWTLRLTFRSPLRMAG